MPRPSRTLARAGASVVLSALAVLGPLGAGVASAAAPTPVPGQTAMPGMDHDSMPGMDHGSLPGTDHGSAVTVPATGHDDHGSMPGMDDGSMPGMDDNSMPGMVHSHGEAAPGSRPRGVVLGGFALVNGLVLASAAVLRRRRPARRPGRPPRRPRPAAA